MSDAEEKENSWFWISFAIACVLLLVVLLKADETQHLRSGREAVENYHAEFNQKLANTDRRYIGTEPSSIKSPFIGTSVKNFFWLVSGSGVAASVAFYLFLGARQYSRKRIFSISLYAASAILSMEVFVTIIRFFTHS